MNAKLAPTEADHHCAVPREAAGVEAFQAQRAQAAEQFRRRTGRRGELEDELGGVVALAAEKVAQRAKHCDAPATKVRIFTDQTEVETSISVGETVITFSEDGRPPRDRFETVPAVEITVPFLVCST